MKLDRKFRRYHYNVYFPANTAEMCLNFFAQIQNINVTYHAANQMYDDPRGIIDMPDKQDLLNNNNTLVEFYELLDNRNKPQGIIQKMLIRVKHLSDTKDFSYLLARESYIVSAWANDKGDIHRLNKKSAEYYNPGN